MKNSLLVLITTIFFVLNINAFSAESDRSYLEKLLNRDLPGGSAVKKQKKKESAIKEVESVQNLNNSNSC